MSAYKNIYLVVEKKLAWDINKMYNSHLRKQKNLFNKTKAHDIQL